MYHTDLTELAEDIAYWGWTLQNIPEEVGPGTLYGMLEQTAHRWI